MLAFLRCYDGYMYFGGAFYVPIDEDKLTKELPDEWRELSKLSDQFREKLDVNASVYAEEVEIEDHDGLKVAIKMATDGFESNPEGYESFLEELAEVDKKFDQMKAIVRSVLQSEGYMGKTDFESMDFKEFSKNLANFEFQDNRQYVGEEDVIFASNRIKLDDFNQPNPGNLSVVEQHQFS